MDARVEDAFAVEAMDHFMLADDRRGHPMTFFIRAEVRGRIEPDKMKRAVANALVRHPLLRARVAGPRNGRTRELRWIPEDAGIGEAYLDFGKRGEPLHYPDRNAGLDPWIETAVRLFIRSDDSSATLLLQVHHAACDAMGAVRFLEDILSAHQGEGAPLRMLAPELLHGRGTLALPSRERWVRLWRDLDRIFLFFRKLPRELAEPMGQEGPYAFHAQQFPASARLTLDPRAVADLKAGAKARGATLNDLMLAELFRTVDAWNRQTGAARPVRLAMAINMRKGRDQTMPAANVVSMCFLDRTPRQIDSEGLQAGIVAETQQIKAHNLGHAMLLVGRFLGRFRGGLPFLFKDRPIWRCQATAVLSNLGQPLADSPLARDAEGRVTAGGLTLTGLELLPPVRPRTHAAFGVVTYAGRLHLTLHFDHTAMTQASAEALLAKYEHVLRGAMRDATATRVRLQERIAAHAARGPVTPFRGLPIGKNVGHVAYRPES